VAATGVHLAAYDLSDDGERSRVDRVLRGYGFRVQWSVFECRLSRGERERLLGALRALDLKSGHVRLYRVYDGRPRIVGADPGPGPDDGTAYIA